MFFTVIREECLRFMIRGKVCFVQVEQDFELRGLVRRVPEKARPNQGADVRPGG
ncbi:MAG: hypothetical protein JWN70_4042 [Planctomycetaceae bacterium]|nr:hypothetical protein [Planctomycetaceae bacterium]